MDDKMTDEEILEWLKEHGFEDLEDQFEKLMEDDDESKI
jgi:hypothetical protein